MNHDFRLSDFLAQEVARDDERATGDARPGDEVHVLRGAMLPLTQYRSEVLARGATLTVTPEMVKLDQERHPSRRVLSGEALDGPQPVLGRGPWPEGLERWEARGDAVFEQERRDDLERVSRISEEGARNAAHREHRRRFGTVTTSTVIASYGRGR